MQWPITHYPSRSQLSFGPQQVQQSWPRETLSVLFHMVVEKPSSRRNMNLGKPGRHFINASQLIKKNERGLPISLFNAKWLVAFCQKYSKFWVLDFGYRNASKRVLCILQRKNLEQKVPCFCFTMWDCLADPETMFS